MAKVAKSAKAAAAAAAHANLSSDMQVQQVTSSTR